MSEWVVPLRFRAELGEGLHWDASRGVLWFVDISSRKIACWRPGELNWREWTTSQRVGWVLPLKNEQALLVGLQQGVGRVVPGNGLSVDWVCRLFCEKSGLRLNDAKADATGAVWAGSMNNDDENRADGCLYRVDAAAGQAVCVDTGYHITNGPAIHPSGDWMLHTDSALRTIYRFSLDVGRGSLRNRQVWKVLADSEGYPDGMGFDAEGCLWLAHWGAGCISRYTATGTLLRRVQLPTSHVSNVCFGGSGLDRLFVTTARSGLTAAQLATQPLAGALFEVDARGVLGFAGFPAVA